MGSNTILRACLGLVFCLSMGHSIAADSDRMEVVDGQDITGKVFMRLGLPNQGYCYQQCLQEDRCTAVRWGFIEGATAGQCQLLTGELVFSEPHEIKTEDGQRIVVVASKRVP